MEQKSPKSWFEIAHLIVKVIGVTVDIIGIALFLTK